MKSPKLLFAIGCIFAQHALTHSAARAADPDFSDIQPRGGQRGTDVAVTLTGARLTDAAEVVVCDPGITVKEMKVVDDKSLTAVLQIAPECPLGEHIFRIRTLSGITYARSFWAGQFPQVDEKEPNTVIEEAQPITTGVTVAGVAKNEDADFYKIDAKKGERLSVEVEGIRLGNAFWDPYVAILNSKKFELATSDDSALLVQDCYASIVAPEDDTYYIEVRDSSYAGRDNAYYRMHVGAFPRPATIYPGGGKPGEQEITLLGDVSGEMKQQLTVPETPGENFPVFAQANGLSAPSPNSFRVSRLENVLEAEPNNNHAEAKEKQTAPLAAPLAMNGIIEAPGDEDWIKFTAKKDQKLDLTVYARDLRSPLDAVLELFNKDGGGIGSNDDNGTNPDCRIANWTVPEDGEYYIKVRDQLARGGPAFIWRVEITVPEPSMNAYITRFDRVDSQMRQQIPVAKGNRYAALINVDRVNCGGDVLLDALGLPAGVTLEAVPLPNGQGQCAVVFSAAADAAPAVGLTNFLPKPADAAAVIPGRYTQKIEFVQGEPNNTPYVVSVRDRMPVVVTEEVPWTLEIVKPTVPIVQSGTMNLLVRAKRKDDFKAKITLRMMWNPPGISSPGTVDLPEGQSEIAYPITANGDAALNTWKLTVLGESNAGNGTIFAAAPLTELTVAAPYFSMKMEMASVEQGQTGQILCKLDVTRKFEGKAKINIYGLPAKVTSEERLISAEDKEFSFPVTTAADSPTGKHQNLFCQAIIEENGVPVPHTIGQGGVLRVDAPPPAPPTPAAEVAAAKPEEQKPDAPPAEKPLSRLEQLRQQAAAAAK